MVTHKIIYEPNPTEQDISFLCKGITAYAMQQKSHKPIEFFGFFVRDTQGKLQGGCNGALFYGCLHVDQLYLEPTLRKQGYGTQLMQAAETLGKDRGCTFATVNTMDWEAREFYEKLGYHIEFTRQGYTQSSIFYFLRKDF